MDRLTDGSLESPDPDWADGFSFPLGELDLAVQGSWGAGQRSPMHS